MLKRRLKVKMQKLARKKNNVIRNRDENIEALKHKCSVLALAFHLFADDSGVLNSNALLKRYKRHAERALEPVDESSVVSIEELRKRYNVGAEA